MRESIINCFPELFSLAFMTSEIDLLPASDICLRVGINRVIICYQFDYERSCYYVMVVTILSTALGL